MPTERKIRKAKDTADSRRRIPFFLRFLILVLVAATLSCNELQTTKTDSFYAEPVPPRKQEFRWSNGKMPKSLDPAFATVPPETDVVRAIYDGLTDLDPKTLHEIPAVAEKWSASDDKKTWTFNLRKDAVWTNGEKVTAADFVRSWKRVAALGESVANRNLLDNIAGTKLKKPTAPALPVENPDFLKKPSATGELPSIANSAKPPAQPDGQLKTIREPVPIERHDTAEELSKTKTREKEEKFGAEASDDSTLKVTLIAPDKDFPRLVANPIFLPVYGDGTDLKTPLNISIVTNGAFHITAVGPDGVTVSRSDQYWNHAAVQLETVKFVATQSAEKALDAYKAGDIDAVTNADFEPLALKLLSPYSDFRQVTHYALNFYEFNQTNRPFNDRRVREALAIGIERERLTEGEMKGSTEPAFHFLPYDTDVENKLTQDAERARQLLESAGYPDGANFPVIRLVVNRNDTQQRIARSVARMWKQNLNLNTEIIVKETADMESTRTTGDFDVIRRGLVFPTVDKKVSMAAIFPPELRVEGNQAPGQGQENAFDKNYRSPNTRTGGPKSGELAIDGDKADAIETEKNADSVAFDNAVFEFRLMPLYFPTSYLLVKPYVQGFEINGLDAPSLKTVSIDANWQPK